MATKPAPRKTVKKPVKPVAKPKQVQESVNTSEIADLKKIIDMQAKQLLQLNKTVGTLQTELKEVKVKIASDVAKPASVTPAKAPAKSAATKASPAKAAPVKSISKAKTQAKKASATPAKAPVKSTATKTSPVRRGAAKAKTPAPEQTTAPVKVPAKRGRKLVQPALDTMVPVPVSVSERLNALTATKKITQTKFAEEVDVPPNLIFDIAAQKMKTISLERIQKITTALKKYETK
ncbi:hypothetical protein [Methanospirillum lacunae]|uniref:Uncharacterized protein n=1 Tax=Methanospirillum lacunae TaxID=668570 RepID=A0A2V2N524_9EURY|nr:hypothetical protein [Methanospirillum lacunae]PWR71618.1 hypothetical protein DK846_12245 [Methanospirillum lacunae]